MFERHLGYVLDIFTIKPLSTPDCVQQTTEFISNVSGSMNCNKWGIVCSDR